jgi:hypothetical protein
LNLQFVLRGDNKVSGSKSLRDFSPGDKSVLVSSVDIVEDEAKLNCERDSIDT